MARKQQLFTSIQAFQLLTLNIFFFNAIGSRFLHHKCPERGESWISRMEPSFRMGNTTWLYEQEAPESQ